MIQTYRFIEPFRAFENGNAANTEPFSRNQLRDRYMRKKDHFQHPLIKLTFGRSVAPSGRQPKKIRGTP